MKKNSITNKITPCCGLPFSVIYWWVSNLTLNTPADRQYLLTQISQNGTLSIDGWKVLVNSGTLEADASLTKSEFLKFFDCGRQPTCEQLKLIIEGFKVGNWTPETEVEIPLNLATTDKSVNGINYVGNVYTKEQTDAKIVDGLTSAYLGIATPTTTPPPTGAYWYKVDTAGTYTNFKDSNGAAIVVTAADLEGNLVYLEVTNNEAKKMVIPLPGVTMDEVRLFIEKYPFEEVQQDEVKQNVAKAIEELYLPDYDPNYIYILRVFRKNQNGLGVPDGYTQIAVTQIDDNGTVFREFGAEKYNVTDVVETWEFSAGSMKAYALIDWSKMPSNTGYAVIANSPEQRLSSDIGNIDKNPIIKAQLFPSGGGDLNLEVADERYAFKSDAAYTKSQSDSKYALVGSTTDSQYKFVDAADFGFLPTNTATQNVTALQNSVNGGNKTITISQVGDYQMNGTVWIDDNTEIIFGKGTSLSISGSTWNVLCNRGAQTRTWNYNISIKGLKVKCKGASGNAGQESNIFGLNGVVNFYWVQDCEFDVEILDLARNNFGFQLCKFKNCVLNNVRLEGEKDGLHLGPGSGLIIRRLFTKTYDDALALNAFDWAESNPEIGDIEDVTVENLIARWSPDFAKNDSRCINALIGTIPQWASNIPIVHGDAVYINGKTYRALLADNTQTVVSSTVPSFSSFTGFQTTAEGIKWKLIANYEIKTASIKNVVVNNFIHVDGYAADSNGSSFHQLLLINGGIEQAGANIYSRSIHPNVVAANYPTADIKLNNVKTTKGIINISSKLGYRLLIDNLKGKNDNGFLIYTDTAVQKPSQLSILNSDLTGILSNGLGIKSNVDVKISNVKYPSGISGNFIGARLNSDSNMAIDEGSLVAQSGDMIINNGVRKVYNGTTWVNI